MLAQTSLDELAAQGEDAYPAAVARTLLDLGRSLVAAQRAQDAVDTLEMLREMFPGTSEWLQGTDFLARLLLGAGLHEACLVLVDQLQSAGAGTEYCDWLRAQALAQLGDVETARRLLAQVDQVVDTGGRRHDTRLLRELRSLIGRLDHIQTTAGRPQIADAG